MSAIFDRLSAAFNVGQVTSISSRACCHNEQIPVGTAAISLTTSHPLTGLYPDKLCRCFIERGLR